MPKTLGTLLIALLVLTGAGCSKAKLSPSDAPTAQQQGQKPTLRITNPSNGATINAATTTIMGETDVDALVINGQVVKTTNGSFSFELALNVGNNPVQFQATNTNGSTVASISITRPSTTGGTTTRTRTVAPKTTTTTAPKVNVTFVSSELHLSIVHSAYGADLSWTKPSVNNIQGYAIVKSTTDPSPYYPKEFWTQFANDYDRVSWRDTALEKGKTTYYRICTIGTDSAIRCGNVASILN